MSLYPEVIAEIEALPDGPQIGAFFDFDGTIIGGYSAIPFVTALVRQGDIQFSGLAEKLRTGVDFARGKTGFSHLLSELTESIKGRTERQYLELAERMFRDEIAKMIYPETRTMIQAHLRKGHTVAVCSSATRYQVEPAARELGVDTVITTQLEVVDGVFTGDVVRPTLWSGGKADAVAELCERRSVKLEDSFFYADGSEDLALMRRIGNPRPLNPHKKMRDEALQKGWPVRDFSSRGRPTWLELVRTGMGVGSVVPAAASALAIAATGGSKREVIDTFSSVWGELSSAAIGLKLDIIGSEKLDKSKPCVYIFNHQSNADFFVMMKLLKRNFTGAIKNEVQGSPFGSVLEFADVALIDRDDHEAAVASIERLAEVVRRDKLSVAIAPEGTRSHTTKLGPFKTGAFHIAKQCGVPIVPVVIHNSIDVQQRASLILRAATVKVEVLDPIDMSNLSEDNLEQTIAEVRGLYLAALGQA